VRSEEEGSCEGPGDPSAVDNVDARGALAQLITRRLLFPGGWPGGSDQAGEHSGPRKIARNEQAWGSSPLPGSL